MTNFLRLHKNLLPLLALAALCVYTVLVTLFGQVYHEGAYYNRAFDFRHYLAFAAVALNLVVYFRFRPWFKLPLIGMLLLGVLDFLSFTPDRFSIGFGVRDVLRISLQPLSLLVIGVYYLLNQAAAHRLLRQYVLPNPTPQQQAAAYQEQVLQFKTTFARKSDESLRHSMNDAALVPAAREAARQLLRARHQDQPLP